MNREELLAIFTQEQRMGDMQDPSVVREVVGPVIRYVSLTAEDGFVTGSNLEGWDVDSLIDEQVAHFERLGQSFEWKVYDYDRPGDLKDRLAMRGFKVGEAEALMVMDLNEEPGILTQPVPLSISKLVDPEAISDVIVLEEQVWGVDQSYLGDRLRRDMNENPEGISVYLARVDGQPASAAWIYFHRGSRFASLWGGSTLPEYRGQGLYSGLLAARAQEAWRRGFSLLSVDASPMSRPILEKRGFKFLSFTYPCRWKTNKS